jgi:hypothetical protein
MVMTKNHRFSYSFDVRRVAHMNCIDAIARTIDRLGIDAVSESDIDVIAALASATDASPVLTSVFIDRTAPAPVRERAFGRLASQIASGAAANGFTLAA